MDDRVDEDVLTHCNDLVALRKDRVLVVHVRHGHPDVGRAAPLGFAVVGGNHREVVRVAGAVVVIQASVSELRWRCR